MKETGRHSEAFEFYFGLGNKRSYAKVAKQFTVSEQSAKVWSYNFNWIERVHLRDIEIAKRLERKTLTSTVAIKAKRLKELSSIQRILTKAIKTAIKTIKEDPKFSKSPADLNFLTLAKERITKLEQLLLGEDTSKETLEIYVTVEDEEDDDPGAPENESEEE